MRSLILFTLLFGYITPGFSESENTPVVINETAEDSSIAEEIKDHAEDTIALEGNEKLIEENVEKISLALNSISNNKVSALDIRETLMENIKTHGTYEGLVVPSLKMIDGFYASNRGDLAKYISPLVNKLNPSIGGTLEEKFGLPLETDRRNDFSRFGRSFKFGAPRLGDRPYIDVAEPTIDSRPSIDGRPSRGDLPGLNDNLVNRRRGPIFGTPDIMDPRGTLASFDGCIDGCNRGYTPGSVIGGIVGTIIGKAAPGRVGVAPGWAIGTGAGGVLGCVVGCVRGIGDDKPDNNPKPEIEPKDPKDPKDPVDPKDPTKPESPKPENPVTCRTTNCDDGTGTDGTAVTTSINPNDLEPETGNGDDSYNPGEWTTPENPYFDYFRGRSNGGYRGYNPDHVTNPGNPYNRDYGSTGGSSGSGGYNPSHYAGTSNGRNSGFRF